MANSFTRKISWLWQNAQNLLIILFLATFTLNIRKVFLTPFSFLNGTFNEYMTMSFSWADALMMATILIYTIKYIICQSAFGSSSLHETSQEKVIKENNKGYLSSVIHCITNASRETYLLLLFVAWCFVSIAWSSYKPIATYRCLTLLEIFLFFIIVYKNLVADSRFFRISLIALMINGFIQAIIGVFQFFYGHSLGLRFLGESIVSRETPGVAKLVIDGAKHIRAYGTFPHPNIMAGFLIIPLTVLLVDLFTRWWPKFFFNLIPLEKRNRSKFVARETLLGKIATPLLLIFLLTTSLGFALTFSRSAFLGLFMVLLFVTFSFLLKIGYKQKYWTILLFTVIVSIGFLYFIGRNTSLFSDQSMKERSSYINVSRETISEHPLAGIGVGQFVLNEYTKNSKLEGWQYQPVHNIYLLISSELGIIGVALFFLFIVMLFSRAYGTEQKSLILTQYIYYIIIYAFLIIFFFDHYFWDIKIAIIIFTLPIVFLKTASCTKV